MSLYYWLIVVTALPCGYFAQTLKQTVPSTTRNVGKTVRFKCEVEGLTISSSDPLHWYQQKPGQAPTRILYYGSGTTWDPGFGDRFKAEKSKNNEFSLRIEKLQEEDTATYYCACWILAGTGLQFGSGTRLIVTETTAQPPKIQIFPPNNTELERDKKATIVCLLTDFFPNVIRVQWSIGENSALEDKVSTDSVEKQEDGNYSVISRLKITKFEWDSSSIHCSAEHEATPNKATISKHSISANVKNNAADQTCSPSTQNQTATETKEWPLSSLQLASFTYTLLLMKSVVYCGIISFILYKVEDRDVKKPLNPVSTTSHFKI
ncbi:immunoglobulin lambda-1 light chain-like [Hemiscyllium ocellatum]|uniref:immunoglobulin lambda-1 light chain-like n=1 Tax=Hemiscyllium ocellatum TaxID=170820 RepID=UPI002966B9F6|nr:immunoglobulin lambda-1 light chain-like [Hemiscyllium ocellatum]